MRKPPFHLIVRSEMERYRWDTFWTKEPETIAWIESFQPGDVFWDIGANIGVYSLYAGTLYPGMKIYAIEPVEANFKQLHWNKKFNEMSNWFNAMRYAVGDEVKTCRLYVPDESAGATGAQANDEQGEEIEMVTVDHLVEHGCQPPTHVKIDIDGQEERVLKGMKGALQQTKSVLVEVSSKTIIQVLDLMADAGFAIGPEFNTMTPHSRERRRKENIDAENIIFMRR